MAGRHTKALAPLAGAALLLAAAVAEAQETSARYTAQRPPRVAVLEFDDPNTEAAQKKYAATAEAMLVTFLESNSQFAVVERQKLSWLYEEKRRIQQGLVDPEDDGASELLKKADAFILVNVSLLDGSRIEIDTKLFSGFDAEIVATAQRSGPKDCLRAIVERLGAALEQDFLRPYQGKLRVEFTGLENVRIFLTPIPLNTAPDEDKVPAEQSSTVKTGNDFDTVESWITNPAIYTVENLLSGWYTLRLARPGYEDLVTDNRRFEVRLRSGREEAYDRKTGLPLNQMDPDLRRFVVRVDPQAPTVIDGDALGFTFRKKGGSLALRVKRKYLDTGFLHVPQRVLLMGGKRLDLNRSEEPRKPAAEPQCDLLREQPPPLPDDARTLVALGQTFDFAAFKGGELIIEDYRGEVVPTGQYQLALWDTHYRVQRLIVTVRDGDRGKVVKSDLARETLPLILKTTGAEPAHHAILEGRETGFRLELPLDFTDAKERGLPADTYKVSTNVPGLDGWKRTIEHFPGNPIPPRHYPKSSAHVLEVTRTYEGKPVAPSSLIVKTRFVLAGRLDVLSRALDLSSDDLFIDGEVEKILDLLLREPRRQPGPSDDLRRRLEITDLLIFNPRDMALLRQSPETVAVVQDYVKKGGALFAFVSEPGDYSVIVGAPLVIETPSKVLTKRPLLSKFPPESWRVIAFTEGRRAPKVLERGEKKTGGYVALWLDDPSTFRDRSGRAIPKIQETRGKVEERVLKWARYLMYRRYDKTGKLRRQAEEALGW